MIRKRIAALTLMFLFFVPGAQRVSAQGGYDLFQRALVKERTDGKLDEAIQIYQRITRDFAADRPLVAKALLAMGKSDEKHANPEARKTYDRLIIDYADQRTQVADARARLAALSAAQVGQTTRLVWKDLGRGLGGTDVGPPSADGRYVSFSQGNAAGLAILDLKTGTIVAPTKLGEAGAYVESSVVSPDGRQVAYIWDGVTASNGENTEELRIIQMKGGKAAESRGVHLNHGYMGVHGWSPDGKSVVVVREQREGTTYTSQIAIISIPGGAVRVLKKGIRAGSVGGASFSPDGRYVAYHARDGDNTTDIFVVAHDGSETRLVESPGDDRNPMWSPDGSHIVFLSTRTGSMSVWMVPVSGGRATGPAKLVKSDVGRFIPMGITRSGSLHYISGSSIVNVHTAELNARLNAGAAPSMATNINVNSNIGGVWSPDGQSLAYHTVSPRGVFIRIRSAATGQDREVPAQIIVSGPVRWFPNGQSLLVASRDARVGGGPVGYYRVNVTTGNADLLHQTTTSDVVASRPDLSSDGNTIFYLETPQQPVRFDLDSRRETRLPPVGGRSLSLAVSPDGSQIAYLSGASLVTAPAVGGEPRQLVRFPGGSKLVERQEGLGLAWSPDQRHVFFVKPNIPAIWRVPAAGGEAENIGISMNRIRALRMHPDGRRITFDSVIDAPSELWVLENFLPKPVARR